MAESGVPSHWLPSHWLRVLGWGGVLLVSLLLCFGWLLRPNPGSTIQDAEALLIDGKAKEALVLLDPILKVQPPNGSAWFVAGKALSRLKSPDHAVEALRKVPSDHPRRSEACFVAGEIALLQLFQLSTAEALLRETLSLQPDHNLAQGHLAGLYGLCGLTSLTTSLRLERLYTGKFAEVDLLLLALGDTAAENAASLSSYIKSSPDDPLTLLGQAHQAWQQYDFTTAQPLYEQGLAQRPELFDAQARLGRILLQQTDPAQFLKWHAHLPAASTNHSEIWAVRGDWSLRQNDTPGAIRCYWEACRRDPTHRRAHHQLGQCLSLLEEPRMAGEFQRRNALLQELLLAAKQSGLDSKSASALRSSAAANACQQPWEAWGWIEAARRRTSQASDVFPQLARPAKDTPRVLIAGQPALEFDLKHYQLPRWLEQSPGQSDGPTTALVSEAAIHFTNDAERLGLQFAYINGDDLPGPGMRIVHFAGGGVGALDFDRDGWPDLYFTQGGKWPVPESNPQSDALFRNRGGERFEDVSVSAGIIETDYSQGLAVGDIDADGWPDLFVANVAGNRLFRNNGDGTFTDITQAAGVSDNAWTTSAALADFNGDGLPDLYAVNYLEGPGLRDRICQHPNGGLRACTPHEFDAAEDQLLLNLGDGRFQDVSSASGIISPGGKGLGIVAADFDGTGRLSIFVGNDTTANFFFHNTTNDRGGIPSFTESAVLTGLAFDRDGRSQACMGIAADDANGDARLDLFVTNYYNESNTLYVRQSGLMFLDGTVEAGLREPSLKQLGFGTQFLDADLDGWQDLVVTNGHIDDETARDIPLHMPTQFFHNQGGGKFAEVPAARLGKWFEGKYLGRGLARLDWNQDGREEFAVSNLDSPAALLTNESPRRGRYVALQLVGTTSAREAIGAIVQVKSANGSRTRQLTAGDGYQASNERKLIFAVGTDDAVDVTVRWPSGQSQSFHGVSSDNCWLVIEGREKLTRISH